MQLIFVAIFGLLVGSFLNVVIYRIPINKSIVYPRSQCNICGNKIKLATIAVLIQASKLKHLMFCYNQLLKQYVVSIYYKKL